MAPIPGLLFLPSMQLNWSIVIDINPSHDLQPSILKRPLTDRASSNEPQPKRQKADGRGNASNIMTRVSTNIYGTLDEVLRDIDSAVSSLITELELPDDAVQRRHNPIAPEKLELATRVLAFKSRAHNLVSKHNASEAKSPNTSTSINNHVPQDSLVLSLYGNTAAGPKQLFSSRQQQYPAKEGNQDNVPSAREVALPSGMFTTDVGPTDPNFAVEKKRGRTLGELFPTPKSLPKLEPPQPSKVSTTREATVGWYQPSAAAEPPRAEDYYNQPIATGQWLDYSNASPPQGSRRKHRGRTMSVISSKVPHLESDNAESEAAKLDALFRSAYSSFAPSRDDSAALVTVGFMNRIWWEHNGEKSFERLVENGQNMDIVSSPEPDRNGLTVDNEDEKFRDAVEAYEKEAIDPGLEPAIAKSAMEKDADEVLEGISELLETLNSYQRIRNLSLNSSKGPPSASDNVAIGPPAKPSEAEVATYEVLKTQLALMIGTLPPFAVAKLNPDQLAELGMSTKVPVAVPEYNGVMDEEEAVVRARLAALGTPSASSRVGHPVAAPRHSTSALYGNQYSAPRPSGPVAQQYYASQTPVRTSSGSLQRPPATAPAHYPMQRPASGASYRQATYGTPSYPHQAPRSLSQQYNPSPQYIQSPSGHPYPRAPNQPYQGVQQPGSHASMNARYSSQSAYAQQQQQTPTQNGLGYPYGNGVHSNRQPSPQKALYSPQQTATQLQGPGSYSTPTPPVSQGNRSYIQSMSRSPVTNGASQSPPQQPQQPQHTPQPLGLTTPYSTFMTTAEQASMMERQRAQLAQQQGLQQQARNAAQAGTMGSPSKSQVNGSALAAGL
jgi:hypothetical protein